MIFDIFPPPFVFISNLELADLDYRVIRLNLNTKERK
jgi:hypothetical protein